MIADLASMVRASERTLSRAALRIPEAWLRRLHPRSIIRDGAALDVSLQHLLWLSERTGRGHLERLSPRRARALYRHMTAVCDDPGPPMASTLELTLELPGRALPARLYSPPASSTACLLYFHGGGFVLGDLTTHDAHCRRLAHGSGAHVCAVDYRLAPEAAFPCAVQDAVESYLWVAGGGLGPRVGIDPRRVAVGGDSAGANLATVVARHLRDRGGPGPLAQVLIYPVTDMVGGTASRALFASGFLLSAQEIEWFNRTYAPGADRTHPDLSPLRAEALGGLPPTLMVTAGFDPLRDEGRAYAAGLREAGVATTELHFESLLHGFVHMSGISASARRAAADVAAAVRRLLA